MPTRSATSIRGASQGAGAFGVTAERLRRAGDFTAAIDLCRQGLAQHPGHVGARVTLGLSFMATGRDDDAFSALEEALRLAPDNLAAIRGLAELHERGVGGEMVDPSMFDLAESPEAAPLPAELHRAIEPAAALADAPSAIKLTAPEAPVLAELDPVLALESFDAPEATPIVDADPLFVLGGALAAIEEAPVAPPAFDDEVPPAIVTLDAPVLAALDPVVSLVLDEDVPAAVAAPEAPVADEFDLATAFAEPADAPALTLAPLLVADAPALVAEPARDAVAPACPDPFEGLRLDDLDPELPAEDSLTLAADFSLEDVVSALDAPVALHLVPPAATMATAPDATAPQAHASATAAVPGFQASVVVQASIVVQGAAGVSSMPAAFATPEAVLGSGPADPPEATVVQAPVVVPPAPAAVAQVVVAAAVSPQPVAVLTGGPAAVLEEWLTRIHTRRKILSEYAAS